MKNSGKGKSGKSRYQSLSELTIWHRKKKSVQTAWKHQGLDKMDKDNHQCL